MWGRGRRPKKLGELEQVFRARSDIVRAEVQPGVVLETSWKDLELGCGPASSLFVLGDEVLRFDCFGPGRGHYHAEVLQAERAPGRLHFAEATVEAQIERTLFELTHNLGWYLGRNPRRAIRRFQIDAGAVAKACHEARERMLRSHSALSARVRSAPSHTGGRFDEHLEGTAALLAAWKQRAELVAAGRYHSVYGNEFGRGSLVDDPDEVVREIGAEAEALVRLWTEIDRDALLAAAAHFTNAPVTLPLRAGGERTVTARQYLDLAHLLAANRLEIAARNGRDCRRLEPLRPVLCAEAVAELERRRPRRWWR